MLPALYALAARLLAPWVCGAALVLGFLFHYGIRFEKRRREDELRKREPPFRQYATGGDDRKRPSKGRTLNLNTHNKPNRDEPFKGAPLFFFVKLKFSKFSCLFRLYQ